MNYEQFYRMIKEGGAPAQPSVSGDANRPNSVADNLNIKPKTTTKSAAPVSETIPASTSPPPVYAANTKSAIPDTTNTIPDATNTIPDTNNATQAVKPVADSELVLDMMSRPIPGMRRVPTAEQLANKWIKEKEDFYRNKAGKYPQYANWKVSNQTRNHLLQQAQNMLNTDRNKAMELYYQDPYNPNDPTSVYRDEAFEHASIANTAEIEKANAPVREARRQAEEAQKAQQSPMQNPVAPAAIGNPTDQGAISGQSASSAPQAPLSLQDKVKHVQEIMAQLYRANGYHPDSLSPQRRDMRNVLNQMLSQYFPQNGVMSPLAQYYQYCSLLGIQPFGSEQDNINRLQDAYTDSQHFQEYTPGPGYTGAWQNSLNAPDWNKGYTYY